MTDKTITILDDDPLQNPLPGEAPAAQAQPEAAATEAPPQEEAAPAAAEDVTQEPTAEEVIQQLMAANAELTEQVKRTSAEFQNFRRRQEEEAKRVKVRIREDIIRTMLPILDHLDRTITAVEQGGDGAHEALLKGIELIEKDVQKIFGDHGLSEIVAEGEIFDAALHQAVMMQETEEVPDQTILKELQKGYLLGDRVIRPSMVQVARNS